LNTNKIDNPEFETKVVELIRETGKPVTTDFVANRLGVCWNTSRNVMMNMAFEGRLVAIKTTMGYVFTIKEAPVESRITANIENVAKSEA
jgi:hypothetical protein